MRNRKSISPTVLLFVLAGCATQPAKPGLPRWDYDETRILNITAAHAGALIGGFAERHTMVAQRATIEGMQEGIDLTPSELSRVILRALTPRSTKIADSAIVHTSTSPSITMGSWTVSDSNEGQITTDWKTIPGKTAGLFSWKKEYDTQVRHIISIAKSSLSSHQTNFSILTEVRERPNKNYDWVSADPELGRKSFENIKDTLLTSVQIDKIKRGEKK